MSNNDIYLHFLDREFLSTLGLYNFLNERVLFKDVFEILLISYEPTYISTSLVFENKFCSALLKKYPFLFSEGHIELALNGNNLPEFIYSKKQQYSNQKDRYGFYFNDLWQKIVSKGVVFRNRNLDTGKFIEDNLLIQINLLTENNSNKNYVSRSPFLFLEDDILNRENRAIRDSEIKEDIARNQTTEHFKSSITRAFSNGEDFCYETNFDSQPYPMYWAEKAKDFGYLVVLHFFCIESRELANKRVENRAKEDGHFVPVETVHHKWKEGYKNLNIHYLFFDHIIIFDNTPDNSFPNPLFSLTKTDTGVAVVKFIDSLPEYSQRRFPDIFEKVISAISLN